MSDVSRSYQQHHSAIIVFAQLGFAEVVEVVQDELELLFEDRVKLRCCDSQELPADLVGRDFHQEVSAEAFEFETQLLSVDGLLICDEDDC